MHIQPELIERCLKGEPRAETELYEKLYSMLMSVCMRYLRQEEKAREMVNSGYFRILKQLPKYQAVAPFQYWARKVMVNVLINEHKKEKIHYGNHNYVENYKDEEGYAAINSAIEKYELQRILQCIDRLPEATRNVFNLFIIDGYSHHEIAGMLGISEGTSKWHLNNAREKLKVMLIEKKTKAVIENDRERKT